MTVNFLVDLVNVYYSFHIKREIILQIFFLILIEEGGSRKVWTHLENFDNIENKVNEANPQTLEYVQIFLDIRGWPSLEQQWKKTFKLNFQVE